MESSAHGFCGESTQVTLSNGDLEAVPQGRINFSAQARLKKWAYTPSSPITANISGSQISIADLERLANKTYPVSGTLALNVSVHGSQLNPVGQGTLTVTKAKVSTEPIQNLNVKFEGEWKHRESKFDGTDAGRNGAGQCGLFPQD